MLSMLIEAVYQGGLLKPMLPLPVPENERVKLRLVRFVAPGRQPLPQETPPAKGKQPVNLRGVWAGRGDLSLEAMSAIGQDAWERRMEKTLHILQED